MSLPQLAHDKANHWIYGNLCAVSVYVFTHITLEGGHLLSLGTSCACTILLAVGKEFADMRDRDRHTPDWRDAAATIIGGAIGVLTIASSSL